MAYSRWRRIETEKDLIEEVVAICDLSYPIHFSPNLINYTDFAKYLFRARDMKT